MEKYKTRKGELRYRECFYQGNKKITSVSFKRLSDAKAWKIRMEAEKFSTIARGEQPKRAVELTFKDYSQRWMHNHVSANCTKKTYQIYESILRVHLLPVLGSLNLSEIEEGHGVSLMNKLRLTHQPKGVKNIWIVLKAVISSARRDKIILCDPFENIKTPKTDLLQDNFWVKDEINQFLLSSSKDSLYTFFFVAIHSGLRLAELCGLKWDRIDFPNNQIAVTRTRDKFGLKETTKTQIKRFVPMTTEVRATLLGLFKNNLGSPYVFLESNGEEVRYAHVYRRFQRAQSKAGIENKIRFHDLRHSFASNFMMNGGNVFDLQKLLGHTDIKMTMRYAHFTPNHLQSSLKFMNMVTESETTTPNVDHAEKFSVGNLVMLGT